MGSLVFRSAQFAVYEAFYTKWEKNEFWMQTVPGTGGVELRVFGAGWLSGTVRSGLECPFEYVKVKRQTG